MTNTHVISALRLRRAEISGNIHDLEKRMTRASGRISQTWMPRSSCFRLAQIPMLSTQARLSAHRYFAHNELSRLTQYALRTASGPLTSAEIATTVMQAKGMPSGDAARKEIVAERVLTVLRRLRKHGAVAKHGTRRDARRRMGASASVRGCECILT